MKTQKLTTLLVFFAIINSSGCLNKIENLHKVPTEAKKRIITSYYEPILNDGSWICGEELEKDDYSNLPDTAYYDEYDNLLLSITKHNPKLNTRIKKNIYSLPAESKLKSESTIYINKEDLSEKIEETEYIRDSKGILLQIKGKENSFFTHDASGFITQELDINKKIHESFSKTQSTNTLDVVVKKTYETSGEIREKTTYIINRNTKKNLRETTEYKSSGEMLTVDIIYYYDSSNRLTSRDWKRTESSNYTIGNKTEYRYNFQGDIESITMSTQNKNGSYDSKLISHKYEYEYNKKGDWIKKVVFNIADKNINIKPLYIITREIDYFDIKKS